MRGLLLSAIREFEPGNRIVAVNDPPVTDGYADDTFPRGGLIPNSILIELIVQLASHFLGASHDFRIKAVPILLTTVSFSRALRPGAQLIVEEHVVAIQDHAALMRAVGTSDGANVVEAEFVMGFANEGGTSLVPINRELQRMHFEAILERSPEPNERVGYFATY